MRSPVLPGLYADPNIVEFGDTYYIYATTDGFAGWGGKDFYVWKSTNLVDWTRSAEPFLTLDGANGNVPWATGNAWAPTIIERDGKYYFYFSGHNPTLQPQDDRRRGGRQSRGPVHGAARGDDPQQRGGHLRPGDRPGGVPGPARPASTTCSGATDRRCTPSWATTCSRSSTDTIKTDQRPDRLPRGLVHELPRRDLPPDLLDRRHRSPNYRVGYATSTSVDGPWTYRGVILEKDAVAGHPRHRAQLDRPGAGHRRVVHRLPPVRDPRRRRHPPGDHHRPAGVRRRRR